MISLALAGDLRSDAESVGKVTVKKGQVLLRVQSSDISSSPFPAHRKAVADEQLARNATLVSQELAAEPFPSNDLQIAQDTDKAKVDVELRLKITAVG